MSRAARSPADTGAGKADVARRLAFFRSLQTIGNRIHAARDADEILIDLREDIAAVFDAERLTIYVAGADGKRIVSRIRTGLTAAQEIELPLGPGSIAGFVAQTRRVVNFGDVYDQGELDAVYPGLAFHGEAEPDTGFRSRQMLAAPILDGRDGALLGVVQLINHRSGAAFEDWAEEGLLALAQTLAVALARHADPPLPSRSKYEHLVGDGVLVAPEFEQAARLARRSGRELEQILIDDYQVRPAQIGAALAKFFGQPYEPYRADRIKPLDLLRNLKREFVEQARWLPLEETEQGLLVVALDPEQVRSSRVAAHVFPKAKLRYAVTTVGEFGQMLDQFFGALVDNVSVGELLSDLGESDDGEITAEDISAAAENDLVRLVNKIIVEAHQQGASDIHIEPQPGKAKIVVRLRKDGLLVPYIEIPASYRNALVTRVKIMCDMNIAERRLPQDGKIKFRKFGPLDIELRVATMPSAGGLEDIVMRILTSGEPLPLERIGMAGHNLARLRDIVAKPYGLFFVCGPTGSGKTTTLHSVLAHLNTPDRKIWTAEDPVEITQRGLRQVQINRKAGLDFATVMRALLRADPDVIMVGEMRDRETTAIGIEASLTGHLVLATLHTNSAPEAVVRLLDMGMDPFNFADALLGVLAQRLVRTLCAQCRERYVPAAAELESLAAEYCEDLARLPAHAHDPGALRARVLADWRAGVDGEIALYRPAGCKACNNTGYKGRTGLHELMAGSAAVKRLVQARGRPDELLASALADGMRTLRMDGIEKVLAGLTDLKQVRSVCIR